MSIMYKQSQAPDYRAYINILGVMYHMGLLKDCSEHRHIMQDVIDMAKNRWET